MGGQAIPVPCADFIAGRSKGTNLPEARLDLETPPVRYGFITFDRLPLRDGKGCWYYDFQHRAWHFAYQDTRELDELPSRVEWYEDYYGYEYDKRPFCENALRAMIDIAIESGKPVDAGGIASLIDTLKQQHSQCGGEKTIYDFGYVPPWPMYPQIAPRIACGTQGETGIQPDGSFLLNWRMEYEWAEEHYGLSPFRDSHGDVCWRRSAEDQWMYGADEALFDFHGPVDLRRSDWQATVIEPLMEERRRRIEATREGGGR